jgi:predicted transcriptional regulator of viral defense system
MDLIRIRSDEVEGCNPSIPRVSRSKRQSLGIQFRIFSIKKDKFFGLEKAWVSESAFMITDREKTIIDGLDLPHYVGGIGVKGQD